MVIARALARALGEAGHDARVIVTPQNPFGQQASSYIATWLTNVRSSDGQPIDQVISLRYPSYAVRHPRHVCWLNHTMREYLRSVGAIQRRAVAAGATQGAGPPRGDPRRRPVSADPERRPRLHAVGHHPPPLRDVALVPR